MLEFATTCPPGRFQGSCSDSRITLMKGDFQVDCPLWPLHSGYAHDQWLVMFAVDQPIMTFQLFTIGLWPPAALRTIPCVARWAQHVEWGLRIEQPTSPVFARSLAYIVCPDAEKSKGYRSLDSTICR